MKKTLLTCLLLCAFTVQARACDIPISTPLQVVELIRHESMNTLSASAQTKETCPPDTLRGEKRKACVMKTLSPVRDYYEVFDAPDKNLIGYLVINYSALTYDITAHVIRLENNERNAFTPEIHDPDWGYGPWFHTALLDREGDWLKIPLPVLKTGWIKMPQATVLSYLPQTGEDDRLKGVVEIGEKSSVILGQKEGRLIVRDEWQNDMPCGNDLIGPPPPFQERLLKMNELYDQDCRILIKPKYTRGC